MNKILCKIFGCDMRYNFPSLPSKCICVRCNNKYKIDYGVVDLITNGPKLIKVDSFDPKLGTDEEIKKRWGK